MARNPELDRLRAEVIKRHEAATKKVSRLRRVAGVELGGTEYDPRVRGDRVVDPAAIRKMDTRAAVAHLRKLNAFTSRRNGFVAGAENAPIPRAKWNQYKAVERVNRELGVQHFSKFKDIPMPGAMRGKGKPQTIGEMREQLSPKGFKSVGFNKGNKAFIDGERSPGGVKSVQALDKLIDNMKKKNRPQHVKENIKLARSNMIETLEGGGVSPELVNRAKRLTDFQVDALWNENPRFARDASEKYNFFMNEQQGGTFKPTSSHADMEAVLESQVSWAEKLQEAESKPQSARRRRR